MSLHGLADNFKRLLSMMGAELVMKPARAGSAFCTTRSFPPTKPVNSTTDPCSRPIYLFAFRVYTAWTQIELSAESWKRLRYNLRQAFKKVQAKAACSRSMSSPVQ